MPIPQHCIECDRVAVVLDDTVPYCPSCYKKAKSDEDLLVDVTKRS